LLTGAAEIFLDPGAAAFAGVVFRAAADTACPVSGSSIARVQAASLLAALEVIAPVAAGRLAVSFPLLALLPLPFALRGDVFALVEMEAEHVFHANVIVF
jgi:hypothetical protein